MNVVSRFSWKQLVLVAGLLITCSCATNHQQASVGQKFKNADSADFIIRYSSDQTIFMLKPDGHTGPFFRIFNRDEICALDVNRPGARELAVVVIGYNRTPEVESQIKDSWVSALTNLKYRRVVFLRFTDRADVDSMRVVEERQLARSDSAPTGYQVANR